MKLKIIFYAGLVIQALALVVILRTVAIVYHIWTEVSAEDFKTEKLSLAGALMLAIAVALFSAIGLVRTIKQIIAGHRNHS